MDKKEVDYGISKINGGSGANCIVNSNKMYKITTTRFPMISQMLLPYLNLPEIFNFSMANKSLNRLIDP